MGKSDSESASKKGKEVEVTVQGDELVYHNPKSQVRLEQPLIDRLFEVSADHPSASRQAVLDSSIQQKLKADRERLEKLGSEVDSKVREAFRNQSSSSQSKDDEKVNSSAQLLEQISSIKEKVQHHRNDNTAEFLPQISQARSAIISCLKQYQDQPLKCTEQVDNFKKVVRNLESKFVTSMQ